MAASNINMSTQCYVDTPNEGQVNIYIDEDGTIKMKEADGNTYTIQCISTE